MVKEWSIYNFNLKLLSVSKNISKRAIQQLNTFPHNVLSKHMCLKSIQKYSFSVFFNHSKTTKNNKIFIRNCCGYGMQDGLILKWKLCEC